MYRRIRPWLFRLDPERAHQATIAAARLAHSMARSVLESMYAYGHGSLGQRLVDLNFTNPIGLAAGFDKNAQLLQFWESLGFGFVEIGSVTARASRGNKRPRFFRLPDDRAIINRMGLPSHGAKRIAGRMRRGRHRRGHPVGVNLAKTHDPTLTGAEATEDYRKSFETLAPLADYVALNISCPNAGDGKTFEDAQRLDELLGVIFTQRASQRLNTPIFLKLAPPVSARVVFDSQVEEIMEVAVRHGISGFIASNTASDRQNLKSASSLVSHIGDGGLSGPPIAERSAQLVRYLYQRLEGSLPIIGVGGVDSPDAAYRMICAGASLVQIYTGLVYEGPGLIRRIKEGIVRLCEQDGHSSIREAIGSDIR